MNQIIKLCLINRNYPPDKGATGYFAKQLVDYLESESAWEVKIISVGKESIGNGHFRVAALYEGKTKWKRLIASFIESLRLISQAKKTKADIFIVMTDPPFLNVCAAWSLRKTKWVLWSMDIYPEAFKAGGLTSNRNVVYRFIKGVLQKFPPSFCVSLGVRQSQFIEESFGKELKVIPSLVGVRNDEYFSENSDPLLSWKDDKKVTLAYVGNLGEAHDLELLESLIKNLNSIQHQVIICCRGSKSDDFKSRVRELDYVTILEVFEDSFYVHIDIQIVSLLKEWTHICVPSKTVTALQYSNAVIFIGNEQSDSWNYIGNAGWSITSEDQILPLVQKLDRQEVNLKRGNAVQKGKKLKTLHLTRMEKIQNTLKELYSK